MEICFVADNNYERFIREWLTEEVPGGDIVDQEGKVIGRHKGIPFYTIGQRKGLGIAHPTPLYVTGIDVDDNRIIVGDKTDVHSREMIMSNINWVSSPPAAKPFTGLVKIRYQHIPQEATVEAQSDSKLRIMFDQAQPAITPGQSAVVYDGDTVLVGGIID
jgi:tRNA-specific 2-thiouridylase